MTGRGDCCIARLTARLRQPETNGRKIAASFLQCAARVATQTGCRCGDGSIRPPLSAAGQPENHGAALERERGIGSPHGPAGAGTLQLQPELPTAVLHDDAGQPAPRWRATPVIGAYAMAVHGVPQPTGDLDVRIESTEEIVARAWERCPSSAHRSKHRGSRGTICGRDLRAGVHEVVPSACKLWSQTAKMSKLRAWRWSPVNVAPPECTSSHRRHAHRTWRARRRRPGHPRPRVSVAVLHLT